MVSRGFTEGPDDTWLDDVAAMRSILTGGTVLTGQPALDAEAAREIRWRYAQKGHPTQKELAAEYGVHPGTISRIVTGKAYRTAGGPLFPHRPTRHREGATS
jgi:hypothetical protein